MEKKNFTFSLPYLGIIGLIFITLKLAGIGTVATWSWWWVLSPFWGIFALLAGFLVACGVIAFIAFSVAAIIEFFSRKKK